MRVTKGDLDTAELVRLSLIYAGLRLEKANNQPGNLGVNACLALAMALRQLQPEPGITTIDEVKAKLGGWDKRWPKPPGAPDRMGKEYEPRWAQVAFYILTLAAILGTLTYAFTHGGYFFP